MAAAVKSPNQRFFEMPGLLSGVIKNPARFDKNKHNENNDDIIALLFFFKGE